MPVQPASTLAPLASGSKITVLGHGVVAWTGAVITVAASTATANNLVDIIGVCVLSRTSRWRWFEIGGEVGSATRTQPYSMREKRGNRCASGLVRQIGTLWCAHDEAWPRCGRTRGAAG